MNDLLSSLGLEKISQFKVQFGTFAKLGSNVCNIIVNNAILVRCVTFGWEMFLPGLAGFEFTRRTLTTMR